MQLHMGKVDIGPKRTKQYRRLFHRIITEMQIMLQKPHFRDALVRYCKTRRAGASAAISAWFGSTSPPVVLADIVGAYR